MRTASVALLAGAFAGCRGAAVPNEPEVVALHVADAQRASAGEAGPPVQSLTEFEARVAEIRARWQERLASPETLQELFDFSSPEMTRLRAEAAREDFAGSLQRDLTLDRLLAGAFVRNADLAGAAKELAGTVEQYAQVTYLDTIMRQYVSFLRTLRTEVGPAVPMDQIQKRFPFPGTLELKAAVVGHSVEAARAKYDGVLRDVVMEVRMAYADLAYFHRALRISDETLAYLRQLEATVRGKLAAGAAQAAHVLQAQVEISALENDRITLDRQRETVRARLNTLLNLPPATPLGEPVPAALGPYPESLDSLYARALEEQPDVRLARARADRMATMIELAEQATYPELSAGLWAFEDISQGTVGTERDREPFDPMPKVMPDPWFGTEEAYLREAREAERAARSAVTAAGNDTTFRVKEAAVQLDTARRLLRLYRDVQLNQAQQAYADAAAGYGADRVEFLNVIDALRRWLGFLLDADRAVRDYHHAHARLESAIGGPVQRKDN